MERCPRGERAGGEVENLNNIFLFVILSDSEGSKNVDMLPFGNSISPVRGSIWPRKRAASICGDKIAALRWKIIKRPLYSFFIRKFIKFGH